MNVPLHSLQVDSASTSVTHHGFSSNANPVKLSAGYHVSSHFSNNYEFPNNQQKYFKE